MQPQNSHADATAHRAGTSYTRDSAPASAFFPPQLTHPRPSLSPVPFRVLLSSIARVRPSVRRSSRLSCPVLASHANSWPKRGPYAPSPGCGDFYFRPPLPSPRGRLCTRRTLRARLAAEQSSPYEADGFLSIFAK